MGAITPVSVLSETRITLSRPFDENPVLIFLAGKTSPHTRRAFRNDLNKIAQILGYPDAFGVDWPALKFQHTTAIKARLIESGLAPASVNRILTSLRGILKTCWQLGLMDSDQMMRAADLKAVKNETLPAGRGLESQELTALFTVCQHELKIKPTAAARDLAILAILRGTGLRRAELTGLTLEDYQADTGRLTIRGKGNKQRTAYLPTWAREYVNGWLQHRGEASGPLLTRVLKSGRIILTHLTEDAIWRMLKDRATQAGIDTLSPHDFRRTLVGDLLDAGADIVTVSKILGHSSPQITARYDRRGDAAKQKASELITEPKRTEPNL